MNTRSAIALIALSIVTSICSCYLWAVPASRVPVTLIQPDGTKIEALLGGDEYAHFYKDCITGNFLIQDEGTGFWRQMTQAEVESDMQKARYARNAAGTSKTIGGVSLTGDVHLPVLLIEFQDLRFTEQFGSVAHYDSILNSETYIETVYKTSAGVPYTARSARNYYMTQSSGLFRPTFDIIGPVLLDHNYSYYGSNAGVKDTRWQEALSEGAQKAINQGLITNGAQWDCDGDKIVDLMYFIYAGYSEAQGAGANYIWPKNGTLSYSVLTADEVQICNVSCSSELRGKPSDASPMDDGIGTIVHEFGHALGLPDFYDTTYSDTCYGMDAWSVMDQGNYNGRGHIPSSMTLHERMILGWARPKELPTEGEVTLEPISTSNQGYILYNPANRNEYLCFENHQHDGNWDQCWGGGNYAINPSRSGLLVTHVDYDYFAWRYNKVNNTASHQRCTPLPADGTLDNYLTSWFNQALTNPDAAADRAEWYESFKADIYPGIKNVTTLNTSNPWAIWFTGDSIEIDITNIEELPDLTLRLTIGNGGNSGIHVLNGCEDADYRERHVIFDSNRRLLISNGKKVYDLSGKAVK